MKYIVLIALGFVPACLMAVPIKGIVKDATTGEELPGVTIIMKEKPANGTVTSLDGSFIMDVPADVKILIISCIGYKKTEYAIDNNRDSPVVILLEPERLEIGEVTVYGYAVHDTEKSARTAEKTSMNVINIMAAKTIELSPDMTVANVLQRVSGISLEKSAQGEGKYPIIRGMDKRYSYTLVNRVKIPSPNDKNRYVPMYLFPAELLEKLEVTKALTPDMESDAIGGAMNLVMKNAPGKFFINANVSTGYGVSSVRNDFRSFDAGAVMDLSPAQRFGADYLATPGDFSFKIFDYNDRRPYPDFNGGLSVGNRFFGHKLGVVASVSYQNNRRFNQSTFFEPYVVPNPENTPSFANMQLRKYSTQTERTGAHVKADYVINRKHSISLYGLFIKLNEAQSRSVADTMLSAGYIGAGSANVLLWERSRVQNQYIGNGTMKGEHQLTTMFTLDWTGALSLATNNMPGWGEFQTQHTVRNSMVSSQPVILPFKYTWQNNRDGDKSLMLNLAYAPEAWLKDSELKVGTLYRAKHRNSYYNSYDLYPKLINGVPQVFESVDKAEMYFTPVEAGYGNEINANHYTSDENMLAAYFQLKIRIWNRMQILTGVRVEETTQRFETSMPEKFEGKRGRINYTDFLPSFHLKYEIDKKQNLRFSYYKAICRPGFFEVIG